MISGALGAIVLTTLVVYWLGGLVFPAGQLAAPLQRVVLGILISIGVSLATRSLSSDQAGTSAS